MLGTRFIWLIAGITVAWLVIALACYFQTWHEFGPPPEGVDWGRALSFESQPSSTPPSSWSPTDSDSGFADHGPLPIAFLLAAVMLAISAVLRRGTTVAAFICGGLLALEFMLLVWPMLAGGRHEHHRVESAAGAQTFLAAVLLALLTSIALLVFTRPRHGHSGTGGSTGHPPASPADATSTEGS